MNNPNGPYPGRQLFLGLTVNNSPCFAYLVTGRSPASRERMAVRIENGIRIGPISNVRYDPLRHYNAVKYDQGSGILVVTNGIQTEAIFETYKLIYNTGNFPEEIYLKIILQGAGAEPDPPLNTPRIAGVITRTKEGQPIFFIGIKPYNMEAKTWRISVSAGKLSGISTYQGNIDNPAAFDPGRGLPVLEFAGRTPQELARFIFDISEAKYNGSDIRVCSAGGILTNQGWNIEIINVVAV